MRPIKGMSFQKGAALTFFKNKTAVWKNLSNNLMQNSDALETGLTLNYRKESKQESEREQKCENTLDLPFQKHKIAVVCKVSTRLSTPTIYISSQQQ